ncbi:hypothetical protein CAOG_07383 [Capsaspora owczarzaki ATCC 30864]|uniref:WW domain-containing protein n=1 Tax=Capsaspora owczarzaki (strain ATCC 30864) TaxID=595528 RepID=A0A0D2WXN6_CAPO3|nr:hypothetical protein CAOG_07383 [Capsaspora owczarzaki ATCC 30864]KJE97543.1 hypothetical protein CAOG_007383 [Capsaspora owczarzaki ATCC 30864]|eukprot:XP_004343242.1 hypothetical protein CAOG_07383 [Capsaspora owczarzaki ATCC 30864]
MGDVDAEFDSFFMELAEEERRSAAVEEDKAEDNKHQDGEHKAASESTMTATTTTTTTEPSDQDTTEANAGPENVATDGEQPQPKTTESENETKNENEADETDGWTRVLDPATSKVYYWNTNTQAVTWKMPEPLKRIRAKRKAAAANASVHSAEPPATEEDQQAHSAQVVKRKLEEDATESTLEAALESEASKRVKLDDGLTASEPPSSSAPSTPPPAAPTSSVTTNAITAATALPPAVQIGTPISAQDKQTLERLSGTILAKLDFLGISLMRLNNLEVKRIEMQTRLHDLERGVIDPAYVLGTVTVMSQMLAMYERDAVPANWTCVWEPSLQKYYFLNQATGETSWSCPAPDGTVQSNDVAPAPPVEPPPELEAVPPPPPPSSSSSSLSSFSSSHALDAATDTNLQTKQPLKQAKKSSSGAVHPSRSIAGTSMSQKNFSGLVAKWTAAREQAVEDEEREEQRKWDEQQRRQLLESRPDHMQQVMMRRVEKWKNEQLERGSTDSPNFEPLGSS